MTSRPPFIVKTVACNTHTHLFQTLLKGLGDDMVLRDWFMKMTGPSAVQLTFEDVLSAARAGTGRDRPWLPA
jgi:cytosine/adenosine deaminase-related metal-dependent hydrolase